MIRSALAALVATTMLTGCFGSSDPKPAASKTPTSKSSTVEVGDCFADADSKLDPADPDFASKIKCTKPHLYEVTGVNPIPDRFLGTFGAGSRDQVLEHDAFARYASSTCSLQLWQALGVKAAGVRILSKIGAVPGATGLIYRNTITPEDEWSKSRHELVCFAEFREPDVAGGPGSSVAVRSYNLQPVFEKFLGSHFPPERRRCLLDSSDDPQEIRTCSRAHDAEIILTFDARLAFGTSFVKDAMRSRPSQQTLDRMAKLCTRILPGVLQSPIGSDLTVWISRGFGWSNGWDLSVDPANGSYPFPVDCHLRPSDPDLLLAPGTVVHRPDRPELEDRTYHADA